MPAGRPRAYRPEYAIQAEKLCKFGCTDVELADFFNVSAWTINHWRSQYPEFSKSTRLGKDQADDRIEHSLYHRALGYTFDSEKIFCKDGDVTRVPYREHVPPDTAAASLWLRNRRPDKWRDVHKFEHGTPGDFDRLSDDDLADEIRREIAAVGPLASKTVN